MLLHGWPDSSFGWRHQLSLLSSLQLPVCAPDLRGFGGTTIHFNDDDDADDNSQHEKRIEDYAVHAVARDVAQIMRMLGFDTMVVVGHDFGAYLAWYLALLYPAKVVGVMALSIPYMGHVPVDQLPMQALQQRFGTCLPPPVDHTNTATTITRSDQIKARFHYMLHHNLPNAHEAYDRNIREALYRIYAFQKGVECDEHDDNDDDKLIQDNAMFVPPFLNDDDGHQLLDGRSAPALWQRIPRPKALPSWLPSTELDVMVQDVQDSGGFEGGLCWYKALDLNWHQTLHLRGLKIQQPCYFMIGENDTLVIDNHGGSLPRIQQRMKQHVVNLQQSLVVPHATGCR